MHCAQHPWHREACYSNIYRSPDPAVYKTRHDNSWATRASCSALVMLIVRRRMGGDVYLGLYACGSDKIILLCSHLCGRVIAQDDNEQEMDNND